MTAGSPQPVAKKAQKSLSAYVEDLQASGRYVFRLDELPPEVGGSSVARKSAIRRLKQRGRISSPRRGFYVIVPLEHRVAGCPPATWFIHDLMDYLGRPYYVALLTAAAFHGASHQQPMVFQVITDRPTRGSVVGRNRIEFHVSRNARSTPIQRLQTQTGYFSVSTTEATAFDLVRFYRASAHLGNVATVLTELAEDMEGKKLAAIADNYRLPEVQRLGYLLDHVGAGEIAHPLARWLAGRPGRAVLLRPDGPRKSGKLDQRWRIVKNEEIEMDL